MTNGMYSIMDFRNPMTLKRKVGRFLSLRFQFMEPKGKVKKLEELVLTEGSGKNFWSVSIQTDTLYMYSS